MTHKILLSLAAVISLIAAAAIFSNKTYEVERVINAPPEKVWAVLMDTASYKNWNPVFIKVDGTYAAGSSVTNRFQDPSGKLYDVTNKVIAFVPNKQLRQKGGYTGMLTFDHQWLLEPIAGGTRVRQFEIDRGLFVWFWDDSWIIPKYTEVLQALDREVIARN